MVLNCITNTFTPCIYILLQHFQPFFVIPKSPKNKKTDKNLFWRIDFHDQERDILRGTKKEYVKPLIKLLKVQIMT